MTDEKKPDLIEIDFDGTKLSLPKEQADVINTARQRQAEEQRKLNGKLGELNASKTAAEALARQQAEEKEAIKLAKDGEIGKVRELLTAEMSTKVAKLSKALLGGNVVAAVARACPTLDAAAQADICALVLANARSSQDDPTLPEFLGTDGNPTLKDGKPVTTEGFVADFLANRKHFQSATLPGKTGGDGKSIPASGSKAIPQAQWVSMKPREQAAFATANPGFSIIPQN